MPWGEFTPMLEDVMILLRLPFFGHRTSSSLRPNETEVEVVDFLTSCFPKSASYPIAFTPKGSKGGRKANFMAWMTYFFKDLESIKQQEDDVHRDANVGTRQGPSVGIHVVSHVLLSFGCYLMEHISAVSHRSWKELIMSLAHDLDTPYFYELIRKLGKEIKIYLTSVLLKVQASSMPLTANVHESQDIVAATQGKKRTHPILESTKVRLVERL
ncbi:hypothetical protein F0562_017772 [Nyssa sinensis]|uniref:Uncharacterized protein n=1 Tax=Nyssa sinensis TaxID=561372 RepID=A0A5J4ZHC8_9ASTE|nr:hypothetical protein F0562_017772 [Nyssa sinensis]